MKGNQPVIFSRDIDANFTGRLNLFIDEVVAGAVDYVENSHYNLNGDLVYNNTVNSPISIVTNRLNF